MSTRKIIVWLALTVLVACLPSVHAAERLPAVAIALPPTGALREGSILPLLDAQMVAGGRMRVLDRQLVDRVLDEQALGAALGAGRAEKRVSLGRMIQADALVLLRTEKKGAQRSIQVIVTETGQGLQLLTGEVPFAEGDRRVAEQIYGLVLAAVSKYQEEIREVAVVPPFESDDATFVNDRLRAVYARYVEQVLLGVPGIQVVDLAEADTVSRERSLALAAGGVARPLPLYVIGRFRSEAGAHPRVDLQLSLRRGTTPVGSIFTTNVPAEEAMATLRRGALSLLAGLAGTPGARPPDPAVELAELGGRADAFFLAGAYDEALPLYSVCSLLAPDTARYRLMSARCRLSQVPEIWGIASADIPRAVWSLGAAFDDLTHVLRVTEPPEIQSQAQGLFVTFDGQLKPMAKAAHKSYAFADFDKELDGLMKSKSEFYLDYLRSQLGTMQNPESFKLPPGSLTLAAVGDETNLVTRYRIARKLQHAPTTAALLRQVLAESGAATDLRRDFVTRMVKTAPTSSDVQDIAQRLLRQGAGEGLAGATGTTAQAGSPTASARSSESLSQPPRDEVAVLQLRAQMPADIKDLPAATGTFSRIEFRMASGEPVTNFALLEIGKWIAASNTDVLCGRKAIYLMRTPGVLEKVWEAASGDIRCGAIQYDGRLLWVPVSGESTEVWALDPMHRTRVTFTTADGLLPSSAGISAQPVGGGQCCVSGAFRKQKWTRSWIAWLSLGDGGTRTVSMVHLALNLGVGNGAEISPQVDASLGFVPVSMQVVADETDPADQRIILARSELSHAELAAAPSGADLAKDAIPGAGQVPQVLRFVTDAGDPWMPNGKRMHHDFARPLPLLIDPQTRRVRILPNSLLPGFAPMPATADVGSGRQAIRIRPNIDLPGKADRAEVLSCCDGLVLLTGANSLRPYYRHVWRPDTNAVSEQPVAVPQPGGTKYDLAWFLVEDLVGAYSDGSMPRQRILAVLAQMGPQAAAAVPLLTAELGNEEWDVAMLAARALGKIGEAAAPALPELRRLAKDDRVDRAANRWATDAIQAIEQACRAK